jgi:hypothetical protein
LSNDKKIDLSLIFEKYYPYVFALIMSIISSVCLLFKVKLVDDISSILNAIISFASIIIGFLGALLALIFSLNNNPIVKYIFDSKHYKKLMKQYFKISINSGFITILTTILLFFRNTIRSIVYLNLNFDFILGALKVSWVFFVVLFSLSSYRLIYIILKISFSSVDDGEEQDENVPTVDIEQEKAIEEMRQELEIQETNVESE